MIPRRIPASALFQLMWRPAAITMVFPLFLATVYPLLGTVSGPASIVAAMSSGFATLPVRSAFWVACVTVPATVGAIVGFVMREPLHSPMGWMLPRYARRLSRPMQLIAVTVALVVSMPVARISSPPVTLAAFCLCLFAFSSGWVVFDPAATRIHRSASAIFLLLVLFRPTYFVHATEAYPLYFGFASLVIALLSLNRFTTKEVVRLRALLPTTTARIGFGIAGLYKPGAIPWATTHAFRVDTPSLLRAGIFETHGGRRFSYAGTLVWTVIVVIGISLMAGSSANMMMIILFVVGMSPSHLKNGFLYPISRLRRAKAFLVSSLFDTFAGVCTAIAAVLVCVMLGLWRANADGMRDSPGHTIAGIVSLAVFAPLAQAAMVPGFSQSQKTISTKKKITAVVFLLLWVLVAQAFGRPPKFAWAAFIAEFALTQIAFWVYLRWYFSKKDLP